MTVLTVRVGPELFRFESKQQWVNKGKGWYESARLSGIPSHDTIALDARARVVRSGREFMRAEQDGAYPVIVYCLEEEPTR